MRYVGMGLRMAGGTGWHAGTPRQRDVSNPIDADTWARRHRLPARTLPDGWDRRQRAIVPADGSPRPDG